MLLGALVLVAAVLVLRGCAGKHPAPATPKERRRTSAAPAVPHRDAPLPDAKSPAPSGLVGSPHVALGIPVDSDPSDDLLLDRHEFVVSYNPKKLAPNWVAWQLDTSYLGHVHRRDDFRADDSLPAGVYHVTPHDYAHSGYDRGHLCPSADRGRTPAMNSLTFLLTNMAPQLHELNGGPWEKLEEHERHLAGAPGAELYIVAGGIFASNPRTIGHGIAVPKATFKIIALLARGQTANDVTTSTEVLAVVMPNEPGVGAHPWTDFVTSVDAVEEETGYDFLTRVPDPVQGVIEARVLSTR